MLGRLALVAACGCVAAPAVGRPGEGVAAPSVEVDPVTRFLVDKGFAAPLDASPTPRPENALIDRVRQRASEMVLTALNFLDIPYRRAGNTAEQGFDCSGFTRYVFATSLGLALPRSADEQAAAKGMVNVEKDDLEPGDLVFFNTLRRTFSHVGIYLGEGKFIHSPRTGSEVRVESMRKSYWAQRFTGARRLDADAAGAVAPGTAQSPTVNQ
jgi:cell wall-associated NlpC family hydrolase